MLRDILAPSKKSLLIWIIILFISSPILLGIWQGSITTHDESWPVWKNTAAFLFFSLNIFGAFLQAPFFFIIRPFAEIPDIVITLGIILNSYIIASLIAVLWSSFKQRLTSKRDLIIYLTVWLLYIIGGFVAYLGDFSNFLVFILILILALFVTVNFKKYAKKIFITASLLTTIFIFGVLGQTISTFEENYCWDTTEGKDWQAHKDCHKSFNLTTALEKYQK